MQQWKRDRISSNKTVSSVHEVARYTKIYIRKNILISGKTAIFSKPLDPQVLHKPAFNVPWNQKTNTMTTKKIDDDVIWNSNAVNIEILILQTVVGWVVTIVLENTLPSSESKTATWEGGWL